MTRASLFLGLSVVLFALSSPAEMSLEEVIKLKESGLGDQVIIAQVKASGTSFKLTAEEMVRLKQVGLSDEVILALIQTAKPAVPPATPEPRAEPQPKPSPMAPATLTVENLDKAPIYLVIDAEKFKIVISHAPVEEALQANRNEPLTVDLPPGEYAVSYCGKRRAYTVKVGAGRESSLLVTRVTSAHLDALYLSILEGGVRQGGGQLVALREAQAPAGEKESPARDPEPKSEAPDKGTSLEAPTTTTVYVPGTITYVYDYYYPQAYWRVGVGWCWGPRLCWGASPYRHYYYPRYYSPPRYYYPPPVRRGYSPRYR